jgi:hypothetical protein
VSCRLRQKRSHSAHNPLEEIDGFGRQGFDFVDFTLESPAALPGQIDPAAVGAALDRHALGVVAHTAWSSEGWAAVPKKLRRAHRADPPRGGSGDGAPAIGIADHRTNGDDKDVEETVFPAVPAPGVAQFTEMGLDG